jgi:hypothetical protein
MTTPNTGIGAITLRTMRAKLDEAAAIARAAEGCAVDGQSGRALMIVLDVEPLAVEMVSQPGIGSPNRRRFSSGSLMANSRWPQGLFSARWPKESAHSSIPMTRM